MRRLAQILAVVALLGTASLAPASALAAASPVVTDCNAHGRLTRQYSLTQLRDALARLPQTVAEYTNCSDVIHQQLLGVLSGHDGGANAGGGSGGSFLPTGVVVVLIVLILGGAGGTVAARRRRA
jgi:hypothetical protein